MAVQIQPTGTGGQRQVAQQQARQVWSQLQSSTWDTLTANQKWEIVRRVLVFVLRRSFDDLS